MGDASRWPITDIKVILPDKGETPPPGYVLVEKTFTGSSANLNKGALFFGTDIYMAFKREEPRPDLPVLTDLTVVSDKEATPVGYVQVAETPSGHTANLNKGSAGTRLFFCMRKEPCGAAMLILEDVGVVNKDERPPTGFTKIYRCVVGLLLPGGCAGGWVQWRLRV